MSHTNVHQLKSVTLCSSLEWSASNTDRCKLYAVFDKRIEFIFIHHFLILVRRLSAWEKMAPPKNTLSGRTILLLQKASQVSQLVYDVSIMNNDPHLTVTAAEPVGHFTACPSLLVLLLLQIPDPTDQVPELLYYTPASSAGDTCTQTDQPSPSFQLRHFTAKTMPAPLLQWCFNVVKSTLHHLYLPVWGWSDTDKRKQLEAVRRPVSRLSACIATFVSVASCTRLFPFLR